MRIDVLCRHGKMALALLFVVIVTCSSLFAADGPSNVTCKKLADGTIRVEEGGTLFTEYRVNCKGTPILWPICSADGLLMTRGYPMISDIDANAEKDPQLRNIYANAKMALATEAMDHPHHRSLWFTHGDVDHSDFWALDKKADVVQNGPAEIIKKDGTVTIRTKNNWVNTKENKTLCSDVRTFVFGTMKLDGRKIRYIDFSVTVTASEGPVSFNDTKEGTFGIRVPGTMDVDIMKRNLKQGKRNEKWGGHIINSRGDQDDKAWAKRADWVEYSGPVPARLDDAALAKYNENPDPDKIKLAFGGITFMNHPKSFRYPTWWHVRTYGLYTANPFGQKDFEKDNKNANGTYAMKKGESFSLAYRVLFHDGKLSTDNIEKAWKDFSATK